MFIAGLSLVAFSLPIAIIMMINIYKISEYPYTYRLANGISEDTYLIVAIIFIILAVIGFVLMFFGWVQRKNKAALESIINTNNQNYCENCKINVSNEQSYCPICGKKLK